MTILLRSHSTLDSLRSRQLVDGLDCVETDSDRGRRSEVTEL